MQTNLVAQSLDILSNYVERQHKNNRRAAARALGIDSASGLLGKWLNGERVPSASKLFPILEKLGVTLKLPESEDTAQDVRLINAALAPLADGSGLAEARFPAPRPHADDYLAVPLVADFAAGPGHIPPENVKDWLIVSRNHMAVRVRKNILGVQLSRDALNMEPTLRPGNIVLVDRDDRNVENGRMFLVREPDDNGDASIKRVAVTEAGGKEQDFRVTYYGDNPSCPPRIYSLQKDFGGDWEKVVVGRVLCVWADMRER